MVFPAPNRRQEPLIDLRPVLQVVGLLLLIVGVAMLLPSLVGFARGSPNGEAFFGSASVTVAIAGLMVAANRVPILTITRRQTFILVVLAWTGLPAFAALPFVVLRARPQLHRRLFRGDVGPHHDRLDRAGRARPDGASLLLWRALLHWLGGIGIIVMAMAILPLLRTGGMQLFHAESSDRYEKPFPRADAVRQRARLLAYVLLSIACGVAYRWRA